MRFFEALEDEPKVPVLVEGVQMVVEVEHEIFDADVAFDVQVQLAFDKVLKLQTLGTELMQDIILPVLLSRVKCICEIGNRGIVVAEVRICGLFIRIKQEN